jgi:hypothetical protein
MVLSALGYAIALGGCTAAQKQTIADVKEQCGPQTIEAISKTQAVLFAVTSVDAAIAGIADIISAAVSDAKAIACIVKVAMADLRSKKAMSFAPQPTPDPTQDALNMGDQILRRLGQ